MQRSDATYLVTLKELDQQKKTELSQANKRRYANVESAFYDRPLQQPTIIVPAFFLQPLAGSPVSSVVVLIVLPLVIALFYLPSTACQSVRLLRSLWGFTFKNGKNGC